MTARGVVRIQELADRLGTSSRALRYYEEAGLLRPERTPGNARLYGAQARRRAALIVELRLADMPIDEISDILANEGLATQQKLLADRLCARLTVLDSQRARVSEMLRDLIQPPPSPPRGGWRA